MTTRNTPIQGEPVEVAIQQAVYRRFYCEARWIDAVTDSAEFVGIAPAALADALRAAGYPVPSII